MERLAARRALLLLLLLSFLLRAALALAGGQRFFPDENRYLRCFILLRHLERGDLGAATDYLLQNPDHTGFLVVGALPAAAQWLALGGLGLPRERTAIEATLWLPALLLALASVACIALVEAIARRAGAPPGEALLAALLMASSTTMLYYSRHLVPYDAALALALLALWLGLVERASLGRSLIVGLLAGCAFLTYNGYWLIALTAAALHCLFRCSRAVELLRRALAAGLAFAALPALLTLASLVRGQGVYLRELLSFSRGAATQTDFSEGWSLPWSYLWHAEHGLLLAFAAGAAAVSWLALRGDAGARSRGLPWLLAAVSMYATMVLLSNGLERIGGFGRLARALVPFLCLATACSAARLLAAAAPRTAWTTLACAALLAQTAFNFATPLRQRFPREVARELTLRYGELGHDASVQVMPSPEAKPLPGARYVLLNAGYLYPASGAKPAPGGRILFRTPQPLEFLPYQYESFVPGARAVLRSADISIRLLDTRPD